MSVAQYRNYSVYLIYRFGDKPHQPTLAGPAQPARHEQPLSAPPATNTLPSTVSSAIPLPWPTPRAIVSIMSGPGEISRRVRARRKVINVSMEGILVESGTIFPLRYLSPIESKAECTATSAPGTKRTDTRADILLSEARTSLSIVSSTLQPPFTAF